jgi:hypothetical protein
MIMSKSRQTISVGFVVGIIGYVSVAVFYAVFDLLAGRGALYTVDLLGKTVFRGLRDVSVLGLPIQVDMTAVIWYSVLHLVLSLVIGLVVTGLVEYSSRQPSRSRLVAFLLVSGFFVTVGIVATLSEPIRPLLPTWSIVVANVFAVLLAGNYLVRKLPGTWGRLSPIAN